jgi:Holliday junction resolvase RusA-like endonuclease
MVKDALQHAGIIDDDMRIVVGSEVSVYEKGVRRTVAVLRPISAEAHTASVAAVLGVLG